MRLYQEHRLSQFLPEINLRCQHETTSQGKKIEILVTWINNFIEMAANTQETILFTFSNAFLSNVQRLYVSDLWLSFPHVCLLAEDILQYLLLYSHPNSTSLISVPILIQLLKKLKAKLAPAWQTQNVVKNLTYMHLFLTKYVTLGNYLTLLILSFTCKKHDCPGWRVETLPKNQEWGPH